MAKEFNMLGDTGAFGLIGQTAELDAAISRNESKTNLPLQVAGGMGVASSYFTHDWSSLALSGALYLAGMWWPGRREITTTVHRIR
jgi:5-enolpyruvylshikimate-3-phosphate synthase